jgi:hypothetical protein
MSQKTLSEAGRASLIADIQASIAHIRKKLDPKLLDTVSFGGQGYERGEEIKIDKARNISFVRDFLNSPQGRHLKDKIMGDRLS